MTAATRTVVVDAALDGVALAVVDRVGRRRATAAQAVLRASGPRGVVGGRC
ncbi:hypothetical protein [Streptomyces brasiliscabiei]|uniref:hypothetical protein n=1 Tax=Streptomyces brasiliscabiei TaxID=2736302 RepID=UPI001C112F56|nr:hypothetical protein [Streptomyces brasiliscabiei]